MCRKLFVRSIVNAGHLHPIVLKLELVSSRQDFRGVLSQGLSHQQTNARKNAGVLETDSLLPLFDDVHERTPSRSRILLRAFVEMIVTGSTTLLRVQHS